MKRASLLFVAASCLALSMTGCFTGLRSGLGQAVGAVFNAVLVSPFDFVMYSEMYWEKNNHWPADFNELKAFAATNSVARITNAVPPFANCRDADFTVLTNGSLEIRYVQVIQTNSMATNRVVISPAQSDSNGVRTIREIEIQIGAMTSAEFAVTNAHLRMEIKDGADK